MSYEMGATAIANPITAIAMVGEAKRNGHRAAVNTAAAGQLGQMIIGLAKRAAMPLVNVVRRQQQVDALRDLGERIILNSSDEDFDKRLAHQAESLNATVAFDAVAGELTGRLVQAMPRGSSVWVYGGLSGDPCAGIDPMELAFGDKQVRGFEIAKVLKDAGLIRSFRLAQRAQSLVASGDVSTTIARRLRFEEAHDGLLAYVNDMSAGKVLLMPNRPG